MHVFKLSNLTLIAGVFFALFILSACAGSVEDEAVPPGCGATEDLVADGTCVPFLTEAECVAVGFKGVDGEGNCIPLEASECAGAGLKVSANGVCIANSYTECLADNLNGVGANGRCVKFTKDECVSARYKDVNGDGKCASYGSKVLCENEGYKDINGTANCIGYDNDECVTQKLNGVDKTGKCLSFTPDECVNNRYNGVNKGGALDGTCKEYTSDSECTNIRFKGLDSGVGNCIVYSNVDECTNIRYKDLGKDGACIVYSSVDECTKIRYKSLGSDGACIVYNNSECVSQKLNGVGTDGKCIFFTQTECVSQQLNGVGGDGKCVAFTNEQCNAQKLNGVGSDGKCVAFTDAQCVSQQFKAAGGDGKCVAYTKAECANISKHLESDTMLCVTDNFTPKTLADFTTTEYYQSGALSAVRAAQAYVNIENLIDADNNSGAIKNGGTGQIVAIATNTGFHTRHHEFQKGGTVGGAFLSIRDTYLNETYTHTNSPVTKRIAVATQYDSSNNIKGGGGGDCKKSCIGTRYASLIGAGRLGTHSGNMQGIAYDVRMKGIISDSNRDSIGEALDAGAGADTIVMLHNWKSRVITRCNHNGVQYDRPLGKDMHTGDCSDGGTKGDANLNSNEVRIWNGATSAIDSDWNKAGNQTPNNTIMVFPSGDQGFNSETGRVVELSQENQRRVPVKRIIAGSGDHNIPSYHGALPALYSNDVNGGRWLTVVALDGNANEITHFSNGCGIAKDFCLAARGHGVYVAKEANGYRTHTGTDVAAATVAGGLALLKGAFPKATPEQLVRLVLDTADYIPLDNKSVIDKANCNSGDCYDTTAFTHSYWTSEDQRDRHEVTKADGTKRYINGVYGYGKLNLDAATTPSITSSYVTASNNESIGVLLKDTHLSLSSHFGNGLDEVKLGIGDVYGRHFTATAPKTNIAPLAVTMDDYLTNWQLLGRNIQSRSLGPQARASYSRNGSQNWMNLQYSSGKATSKIAFQESYKINPLQDIGASSILRANNIRPASDNIGMMDVDYRLGRNLTLSSYAARGEYDTGYEFDELGTDIDVRYKKSNLNIGIGNVREHDQFLGTNTAGGYALKAPTISRFTDVTYGHNVGKKFNLYANYIKYETDVDMVYSEFASIDGLQADQYQVGLKGRSLLTAHDNLNIALITKLGVTDGVLNQNTVRGYTADGEFNNVSQSYDLAVTERHQQFEITYQGRIYQHSQDKVSLLKNNRFFTTVRVDRNLNHVQDSGQTEIVSGVSARF